MKVRIPLLPLLFGVLCLIAPMAYSQSSSVLDAYIQEGLKSNLQLQQEQLSYQRSVESLALARALFLPQVSANSSYQFAHGGRKISIPVGDLVNPVYQNLNQINNALNTGAPQYPLIANQTTNFLATNFQDTKVRVIQNIFNPDIYFNYKAQKDLITVQQAQKNAYENQLKYEIISAYYQYMQSEDALKILSQSRVLLQEFLKVNQKLVANARATKDVVLNTEYELSNTDQQLAENEKNNQVARSYFNFLLNRDLSAAIIKDSLLAHNGGDTESLSSLTTTALQQRNELKQLQNGLRANDDLVRLSKGSAYMPKVNVVGDAGYQGYYYKFDNTQQYWLVQFGLSWDLFKGGEKRTKIQQAKIDYQVMENKMEQLKRQIELQVIQSYYELDAAEQSLATSQSRVKSSEKTFQIIRAKYNEGQAILLEYLDAQNKLTTARLTQSINNYELLRKDAALRKTISSL